MIKKHTWINLKLVHDADPTGSKSWAMNIRKEHIKPLFNTHEIMNVHNLYFYHCINDIFKVLKYILYNPYVTIGTVIHNITIRYYTGRVVAIGVGTVTGVNCAHHCRQWRGLEVIKIKFICTYSDIIAISSYLGNLVIL